MNTIQTRRSIRKFKPCDVSRTDIEKIVDAARLAPSAKNRQPWKFIAYTGAQKDKLLDIMGESLQKEQQQHALLPHSQNGLPDAFNTLGIMRTAPVVIVVINTNAASPFEPIDADSRITELCDTLSIGAAIENMLLAAASLGYGSCWYEGHITDTDRIGDQMAKILGVPEEYELVCFLPVGIPESAAVPPKKKSFEERACFNGFFLH